MALLGFVPEEIDLVVSDINPHSNMGYDVTYSGTVTAAMESVIFGIPAVAFSLAGDEQQSTFYYNSAAEIARQVVRTVMARKAEPDLLLNVNVPNMPVDEIQGIQITRQGMRIYHSALNEREDPRGKAFYWIAGSVPSGVPDFGTDFGAIAENNVSITPLKVDLTDFGRSMQLRQWDWDTVKTRCCPRLFITRRLSSNSRAPSNFWSNGSEREVSIARSWWYNGWSRIVIRSWLPTSNAALRQLGPYASIKRHALLPSARATSTFPGSGRPCSFLGPGATYTRARD